MTGPRDLDGRVALVTGGGKGLGRAFALDLARRGARVVVNNRNRVVDEHGRGPADHVVTEILAAGGEAVAEHSDVADPASGERMVQTAVDAFGRLDACITSAGISGPGVLHRSTREDVARVIDTNLYGTLHAVLASLAVMRTAGAGRIVLVASTGGLHGEPTLGAYAASKGAIIALGRTLAHEADRFGVATNVLLPYATTQMTDEDMPGDLRALMDPAAVAPVVAALVHPDCALNGEVLVVGGGGLRVADTTEGATEILDDVDLAPARLADAVASSRAGSSGTFPTAQHAFRSLVDDLATAVPTPNR